MNALVPATSPIGMEFGQMERLAEAVAKSNLFGLKTKEQALVLMAIAQAEGRHPALAARDYDVIQGRPSKKAEAMLRDFLGAGGHVEWHELTDQKAEATFKHKLGGQVRISWDMDRAAQAGLKKDMYNKFPRQMLRSRCVSEGVRTVWPSATSGMYVPEEAITIEHEPEPQKVVLSYPAPTTTERAIGDSLPDHSAPHPLDEPNGTKWLKNLRDLLGLCVTEAQVVEVAGHHSVEQALKTAPDRFKALINDYLTDAYAKFQTSEEEADAAEPPTEVDDFLAKLRRMSPTEVERLDTDAAHRAFLKSLSKPDYDRVAAGIADRVLARAGA